MASFLPETPAGGYANAAHKLSFYQTFTAKRKDPNDFPPGDPYGEMLRQDMEQNPDKYKDPVPLNSHFMAFVTSFSQTFASTWTSEAVYGRIDPIGTFQGNQRTISVGWDIPSGNIEEAERAQGLVAQLSQFLYPAYTAGGGGNALTLAKPPLIRLKYANLISTGTGDPLLGWINNLSWTPVLDMGMFQQGDQLYPKVISLQVDFTVLHEGSMGWRNGKWKGGATFPFGG